MPGVRATIRSNASTILTDYVKPLDAKGASWFQNEMSESYPPGISEAERRRVRVARGWPLWGALVWVTCEIFLSNLTGPWTAFAASTAAYIGAGLGAKVRAGEPRTRVRTMAATVMAGHRDPISGAARDRLEGLAATLLEADDRLTGGHISAIQHEMIWWRVYDQMSPSAAPGMHRSDKGA